jgi:hypothetical protein
MGSGFDAVVFPKQKILGMVRACNSFPYRLITFLCYPIKCVFSPVSYKSYLFVDICHCCLNGIYAG